MFNREESSPGQVVGTVEVSLVPSTRTRYLTLNAPEVIPEPYPSDLYWKQQHRPHLLKQCSTGAVWALLPQPGALCPFMKSGQHEDDCRSVPMSATWRLTPIIGGRAMGCCCWKLWKR